MGQQVDTDGLCSRDAGVVGNGSYQGVAREEPEALGVAFSADDEAGVQVELPPKGNKQTGEGAKKEPLHRQPPAHEGTLLSFDGDGAVEGDQGESVEVNIVLELLGSAVVLVVLGTPPSTAHGAAHSVDELLEADIEVRVPSEADVTSFVHQPPTPTDRNANPGAQGGNSVGGAVVNESHDSGNEHKNDLEATVDDVGQVGLEPAIAHQLLAEGEVVFAELVEAGLVLGGLRVNGVGSVGKLGKHLASLRAAIVELNECLSSIPSSLEELRDASSRVAEASDIVEATLYKHLVGLLLLVGHS